MNRLPGLIASCLLLALAACSHNGPSIGDTCSKDADCGATMSCYSSGFSTGICSQACSSAAPCPKGSGCAPLVTATLGDSLCLASCSTLSDCKTGYTCCAALGSVCAPLESCTGPVPIIFPTGLSCPARTVVNGGVAGPATEPATCVKNVVTASFAGAQVQVLGAFPVGTTVNFDVPPGTGTISILQQVIDAGAPDTLNVQGNDIPNGVVPFQLNGPDGGVYYNDDTAPPDASVSEVFFGLPEPASAVMTLPNTTLALSHEDGGYPSGSWSMVVNDYAYECSRGDSTLTGCSGGSNTQEYDIQVITKPVAGSTGTVDIGLYLVSDSWTAAAAIADAAGAWRRFLDEFSGIYAGAGLCLGTVTFYDVPPWAKTAFASSIGADDRSPCGLLDQLLTLSQPGAAVSFFFVDEIQNSSAGGGGIVVGIDGAIPGPAGAGGTVHSGALVNVSDLSTKGCDSAPEVIGCGSDEVAFIAAHEGGHFMGLYHTSESDGMSFDPISDTPQCVASCDSNQDGVVSGSECTDQGQASCGGGDYLMFWLLDTSAQGVLSAQQGQIMRANPVVH